MFLCDGHLSSTELKLYIAYILYVKDGKKINYFNTYST